MIRCQDCGEQPTARRSTHDGIEISCDCGGISNRLFVSHKEFHDAPRSWVKDGQNGRPRYLGDYFGTP